MLCVRELKAEKFRKEVELSCCTVSGKVLWRSCVFVTIRTAAHIFGVEMRGQYPVALLWKTQRNTKAQDWKDLFSIGLMLEMGYLE
jgi:hypothetical protein